MTDRVGEEWVLLSYRLPREPSTPRIAVWRRLRQLGVAQVGDGLVVLPADARTREQLDWVADDVLEAGGWAMVWLARVPSAVQERELAEGMAARVAEEYEAVISAAQEARELATVARQRTVGRLRRELRRISQRDFFPPPQRERARHAVADLAASCLVVSR